MPDIREVYDFMVKFEEESFKGIEQIINLFGRIGRGCFKIVIDTSGIDLDLDKQKNRKSNEDLKDKEYRDSTAKFFIFKLDFAGYKTKRPLFFNLRKY